MTSSDVLDTCLNVQLVRAADLLIAEAEQMESFAKAGVLAASAPTKIMLSRVGVAVKQGAPKPDIGSADALKAALMAAKTVGYSQGVSGQHFVTVIQRLGLTDAGNDPAGSTTRKTYDLLAVGFGPGSNGPLVLVAQLGSPSDAAALGQLTRHLATVPGVAAVAPLPEPAPAHVDTGVARDRLERIVDALTTFPPGFEPHPKLARILAHRRTEFDDDHVDWALGEALAFGSLLLEGIPVRVAGQDTRRGTFSQRHSVVVDHRTEQEYTPLEHLGDDAAPFMIYDSVLSEFAAVGFEYGYSVADHDALVCWEAQFGDFANGAQTIIDQFIVAAEDKWGQRSGLAMLLPHGFEGQGPEHSSARLERFLVLCAQDNIRVVYPTTAAQYFHVLRRQVHDPDRKPLVVMTPKRYLRVPATASPVAAFTTGGFAPVLDDPSPPAAAARLIFCTGKFAHELIARRDADGAPVAIVRIEQLYPWPRDDIAAAIARYPNAAVTWAQEEPGNMGARYFARRRIEEIAHGRQVDIIARAESPSPASGSSTVHDAEQQALLDAAMRPPG